MTRPGHCWKREDICFGTIRCVEGVDCEADHPPADVSETTATLRGVVEQAAQAWDQLQLMYDRQDAERKRTKVYGSWPRDAFESWLDDLVQNAKEALNAQP